MDKCNNKKGSNWGTYFGSICPLRILSSVVTFIRVLFVTGFGSHPMKVTKKVRLLVSSCLNICLDTENVVK
jgi:hypothetical protein